MALKSYNPTTPSQRHLVTVDRSELWKGKPVKKLTEGLREKGGRNNTGRITMRRRGGGHKQRYRIIDFKRTKDDAPAIVERLEYDRMASCRTFSRRNGCGWAIPWSRATGST
jgi:large subunit ribosomal protein L2